MKGTDMSKTITLTSELGTVCNIDVDHLLAFSQGRADTKRLPLSWLELRLATYDCKWSLTPRGQDLLASIDSIPDDPVPEQPQATPCKACGGTGGRPLFVSMETCDACGGSGQTRFPTQRIAAGRVHALTIDGVRFSFSGSSGFVQAGCDTLSRAVVETGAEVERQRARLGYSATWSSPCGEIDIDGWRLDGLPDVGRYVEVKVRSGEVLRGQVTETDASWKHCLTIYGCESRPLAERSPGVQKHWATWASAHDDSYTRVGWRYVDAPKLDAPDDSR